MFLFALALKNSALVDLKFFLVPVWQVPLSAALLGAFALGVVVGMVVAAMMRHRQGAPQSSSQSSSQLS